MRPRSIIAAIICSMATAVSVHILDTNAIMGRGVPGDVNGDGGLNIADPIYLLNYIFGCGPAPLSCPRCLHSGLIDDSVLVDAGDGTVRDTETGLIWMQMPAVALMSREEAKLYVETLVWNGHDDWRLPTIEELLSILMFGRSSPSASAIFVVPVGDRDPARWYWSSTVSPRTEAPVESYALDFGTARLFSIDHRQRLFVRPVRGPVY